MQNQDEREFERKKTEFTKKSSNRDDDGDKASVVSVFSARSCASSLGSDISFKTALTSSAMKLQNSEQVEEKRASGRGRGRSSRVLTAEPNVKLGIGRSKLRK